MSLIATPESSSQESLILGSLAEALDSDNSPPSRTLSNCTSPSSLLPPLPASAEEPTTPQDIELSDNTVPESVEVSKPHLPVNKEKGPSLMSRLASKYTQEVAQGVQDVNHRFEAIEPKLQLLGHALEVKSDTIADAKTQEIIPELQPTIFDVGRTADNKAAIPVLASQPASACGPNAGLKVRRETSKPPPEGANFPPSPVLSNMAARGELPEDFMKTHIATGAIRKAAPAKSMMVTYAHSLPYSQTTPAAQHSPSMSAQAAFEQFLKDTVAESTSEADPTQEVLVHNGIRLVDFETFRKVIRRACQAAKPIYQQPNLQDSWTQTVTT
ncbi:uncharacterized protein LOC141537986 [Cotesia typhae]|uniref:uncharacterized protein LOC141537986 n=1 Tax=Cotesia typhae TaxID=2053667 RepID=UPI003D693A8F